MMDRELEVARRAVAAACEVCAEVQRGVDPGRLEKGDKSPVTVADFAAQAVVARTLSDAFADDALVAEEGSSELRDAANRALLDRVASLCRAAPEQALAWLDRGAGSPSRRFWTLDPIDGTKGFLRGEQYAVALGLVVDGKVVLGVLGCPNLPQSGADACEPGHGTLLWALRGTTPQQRALSGGDASAIHVSDRRAPRDWRACESVEAGHSRHDVAAELSEELGVGGSVRVDSQVKYALVARGDAEIYWRLPTRPGYEEKIWDHAAGSLIVEAAGGRVTDVHGLPLDFSKGRTLSANRGVLSTHGPPHEALVALTAQRFEAAASGGG
jgi:HAL2 family 3'(2'),5'-bisphosphate nucleotidase